ncbi:MAG: putative phosphoenolpyruvate-protein phosphotransferase [Chthoniobacteraceae bacterium]|nr:putative phosphoenolpyruvate-protein phosphotransferase [Chthoniobacteraceae bacterium]
MIELTNQSVQLAVRVPTKEAAIRAAGEVLVAAGHIAPGYVESMLGREQQANTYLGKGIAIPHGMQKDRELIHHTGVSVVQVPEGVEWNPGQIVRLVVGIAAKSDEHLAILASLSDVLDDEAIAHRLASTNNPAEIVAELNRRHAGAAPSVETLEGAKQIDATLPPGAGLHARPAMVFFDMAAEFASEIRVEFNGKTANGKAMVSLLKLGAPGGATLRLIASGPDADAALQALKAAVASGLGDEIKKEGAPQMPGWIPESSGRSISGVGASPGLAIGRLHHFQGTQIVVKDNEGDPAGERQKLNRAVESACAQLEEMYNVMKTRAGKAEAAIFRAHQAFLNDSELRTSVSILIDAGHSAAWSWQRIIDERVSEVQQMQNERLAGRAADLHDVGQRVLRVLAGTPEHGETQLPNEPVILVADDLTPSDTARLDPKRILGLCTVSGGGTSHTAIIARSLDIPAVVGAGASVLSLTAGIVCVLDGTSGRLYIEPSASELDSARQFQNDLRQRRDEEYFTRYQPAIMTDGHRVEIVANIGKASEAGPAVEAGAEGIGLLRTEFLFLERSTPPSEEEQFEAYTTMTRALNGLSLVIRTLDIGGDKVVPYLALPDEENPFLGVRGIRLCLRKPELFIPQLRAIYRASLTGPIKMMFPMIATLEELRSAKEMAEQIRAELGVPPIEIGIMVEVPSTVVMAAEFAKECDFFSVGTNDLTQYVLAMDRMHPALAKQVDGLHPAVLRMIDMTVRAAASAKKWVGVCGGIAGDPRGAAILAGLGVSELSMTLPSVAAIKAHLRTISRTQAQVLAMAALECKNAEEVRALPFSA